MTKLSILDLVLVNEGSTPREALHRSLELAQRAEQLDYERFWVAEHHNMPSIASAATSVVIGYLAAGTKKIKVGAGGIMLPNHSPLVIAEQFGTLASLYPDRIDLGLGRAPGTDQRTLKALRRDPMSSQNFPHDVRELQHYFEEPSEDQKIQAIPGSGLNVPLWILGSSMFGSQLASEFGLPYAFASHFAPDSLMDAIRYYRQEFRPSKQLNKPYVMVGINIVAADTDEEARYHFTSLQQAFTNMQRGKRGFFQPPISDIESYWTPQEKIMASHMLQFSLVGSADTIRSGLIKVKKQTGADELMIVGAIHDGRARLKSFEIISQVAKEIV